MTGTAGASDGGQGVPARLGPKPRIDRQRLGRVFALARGTVLAQLVFVLVTPVLTRIYTAEEMGVFGVLAALVLIVGPLAGMRYELAIPLPRRDDVALQLVWLGSLISLVVLGLLGGLYLLAIAGVGASLEVHPLQSYPLIVAASVALFVLNEGLIFYFIRTKSFEVVANARVSNAVSLATVQLTGFLSAAKLPILLGAYPLALAVSILYLLSRLGRAARRARRRRARLLGTLMRRYREFPLYSSWASSVFELSQALPLFVLAAFFGNVQVGYFFLARRIGLIPTSVVGRAISQVNHAEMLEHRRSGALAGILLRQIHGLQWLSVVPAAVLALLAPALCERLLGEEWRVSGEYLQLMTPYVVVRFFFAPMLAINYVAEWQRQGFWAELVSSALSAAALLWYSLHGSAYAAVAGYFAVLAVANLLYRTYLMRRLGVAPTRLLWPAAAQLAALAALWLAIGT